MKQKPLKVLLCLILTVSMVLSTDFSASAKLAENASGPFTATEKNILDEIYYEEVSDGIEMTAYVEYAKAYKYDKFDFYIVDEDGAVIHEDVVKDVDLIRTSGGSYYYYSYKKIVQPGAKIKVGAYGYTDSKKDDEELKADAHDLTVTELDTTMSPADVQAALQKAYETFPEAITDYAYLDDFTVGAKSTVDCAAYKSSLEITKVTKSEVVFKFTLENKFPGGLAFRVSNESNAALTLSGGSAGVTDTDGTQTEMDLYGNETTYSFNATAKMSDLENEVGLEVVGLGVGAYYMESDKFFTYNNEATSLYSHDAPTIMQYVSAPSKPGGYYISEVSKNTIKLGPDAFSSPFLENTGSVVCYRIAGTSKWTEKKFAAGKTMKLTGLDYAAFYEIGLKSYVTEKMDNGKSVTKYSAMSDTMVQVTTPKDKPVIASVKISGAKKRSGQRPGYWDYFGKWHNGSYFSGTTGTVTIKLKKKPKATYLYVNAKGCSGSIVKIKGKKVVLKNVNLGSYSKGKKAPIQAAFTFDSKYKGKAMAFRPIGPLSSAKKVKVK